MSSFNRKALNVERKRPGGKQGKIEKFYKEMFKSM